MFFNAWQRIDRKVLVPTNQVRGAHRAMENIEQYASCVGFERYASIPFQMLSGCVMSRSVRIREVKGSNPSRSTKREPDEHFTDPLYGRWCVRFGL